MKNLKNSKFLAIAASAFVLFLLVAPAVLVHAQAVPQINSSTATSVASPMVQALIDILQWFWANLGQTFMWLAFIGAIVYAIYRKVNYGKVF